LGAGIARRLGTVFTANGRGLRGHFIADGVGRWLSIVYAGHKSAFSDSGVYSQALLAR
jgi:hypothetical protein